MGAGFSVPLCTSGLFSLPEHFMAILFCFMEGREENVYNDYNQWAAFLWFKSHHKIKKHSCFTENIESCHSHSH